MATRARNKKHDDVTIVPVARQTHIKIPRAGVSIQAGFPSPADDYMVGSIDLNRELITHPAATFLGRVRGESMVDAGIYDGDFVVVDKSLAPRSGDVAVCFIDGEFTIKYVRIQRHVIWLVPANPEFEPIRVTPDNDFMIWGVVTYSIRRHRSGA